MVGSTESVVVANEVSAAANPSFDRAEVSQQCTNQRRLLESRSYGRGGDPTSVEENNALACRFLEARGRADLDAMERMMPPEFVDHTLALANSPITNTSTRHLSE